ncbi:DUF106 domain-containing protein [Halopiger djelfimassiliensis]|uniref:DUF106 domain-containing protein n=1 Tax=Halopiger djelfimassiliensis TaxID=1293047 RepID=UPI000677B913|nr:DUF106 domain-containing protein [Halopiger djelfimassiliensis]
MPVDQLEPLLADPAMQDALAVLLDRSDGGTEELEWTDVSDALSSEQWGRLIEQEVLVSSGAGFTLADPERVREKLAARDEDGSLDRADIETERWSSLDKAAGAFALALFAGYWSPRLRDVVASVESVVLGPLTDSLPFHIVILVLAVVTGLYSTVLQSRLTDHEKLEQYRRRLSEFQERKRAATERGDDAALERMQDQQQAIVRDQIAMFKLQFRPTVWVMLLTIPVFLWLRWKVNGGHLGADETGLVVPIAGAVSWQESLVGPMPTWIVWYFLASMASRQLIRKTLDCWTERSR